MKMLTFKTMINTKQRSTRFHNDRFHKSYGIQKWLCSNNYCLKKGAKHVVDKDEYKKLLEDFILHDKPDFDFSKLKHGLQSMENYVQKRFSKFCSFTHNIFKTNGN